MTINEEGAKVVRLIFHKFVNEGKGTHVIARELREEGISPMRVKEWSNTVILRVIRNEKYCGDLVQKKTYKPSDFKIGTGVKVLSMNLNGSVVTLPNADGNLTVKMGILNSKVNIKDLEIIDEPDIKAPGLNRTGSGKIKMNKSLNVKMELNLIGKTVDEALFELDKYLDDAYLAHLPQVYIIHGKGTGTLRNAIQTHLKKCPYVKSYRNGEHGEGGAGATVVEFK